jgi:hypothetical protein
MQKKYKQKKWFEDKAILVILFFILPPLGIYGMIKRNTVIWKKALYIIPASFSIFLFSIFIIGAFLTSNENEKNSNISNEITVDEVKKEIPPVDYSKLIEFQKTWSDSVVKSWGGDFIVSNKLSLPDTIYFELSKKATQSFNSNKSQSLPMYLFSYKNSLKNKFGTQYNEIETYIDFMPNKELLKNNNPNEWTHPVIKNRGLKIYGGNEYSKEYIGSLNCKYKDETNGNTYYVILKDNGKEIRIVDYEFGNYWIKQTDPNLQSAIGISKCY